MKKFLLVFTLLMGINSIASAQYYNETFLFIEVGNTIENSSAIIYVHFDEDGNMYYTSMSKNDARSKYKNDVLDEYGVNIEHNITRDRSISSSKYYIYRKDRTAAGVVGYGYFGPRYGWISDGYEYYGINRDEMVTWNTTNESNEAKNKKYYKAISSSDLIPKEVEYDFL